MKTINIKGKEYVTVDERIRFLRENHPTAQIINEIVYHDDNSILIKSTLMIDDRVVAIGHAQEYKDSSYINKTSYVENCETSAIGRVLGIYGIGVCGGIASADEVINAINNQPQQPQKQPQPQAQAQAQPIQQQQQQQQTKTAPRKPLNQYPNQQFIEPLVLKMIELNITDEESQIDALHSISQPSGFWGVKSDAQLKFFISKLTEYAKNKEIETPPIENLPDFP